MRIRSLLLLAFLMLAGCGEQSSESPVFEHPEMATKPWTDKDFDDQHFQFAIFSDLTGGERERIFEVAVEQLNLLRPELILCVGDLIEGGSWDTLQLRKEWDWFDERIGRLHAPVFRVGGNHDLTNPMMKKVWIDRYGPTYYHFVYKNNLFLILNSEDFTEEESTNISKARDRAIAYLDEGNIAAFDTSAYRRMPESTYGTISKAQSEYFVDVITNNPDVANIFLFVHKPVWLEQRGFGPIMEALKGRQFLATNGHEHTYNLRTIDGNPFLNLATTGGFQGNERAFDHLVLVTVTAEGPVLATLRMDGILNGAGEIPLGGDSLNFQAIRPGS